MNEVVSLRRPVADMKNDTEYVRTMLNIILSYYDNTGEFRKDMINYLVKTRPTLQEKFNTRKDYMINHFPQHYSVLVALDDIIDELERKGNDILKERKRTNAG